MKKAVKFVTLLAAGIFFASLVCAEEITVVGTGDGVIILKAVGDAFTKDNPDVTISIPESIGSGGGVKAVGTDKYLIGRVAREIQEKEKPYGLIYLPFAKVATVFFVNRNVGVRNLSAQLVCDIYSGKIANWKEADGKESKIRVIRREDGDSSLNVLLQTFPGFKDVVITEHSKTAFSTSETFSAVEEIPDSIGFGPYDVAKDSKTDILAIDGKKAVDSDYPSFTTLALIFKEKNKTGNIQKFLEFVKSENAREAVRNAGGIPF